jgi:hypothetical protein
VPAQKFFLQLNFFASLILFLLHILASLIANLWRELALLIFFHLDYDSILLLKKMNFGIDESLNLFPLLLYDFLHSWLELLQNSLKDLVLIR